MIACRRNVKVKSHDSICTNTHINANRLTMHTNCVDNAGWCGLSVSFPLSLSFCFSCVFVPNANQIKMYETMQFQIMSFVFVEKLFRSFARRLIIVFITGGNDRPLQSDWNWLRFKFLLVGLVLKQKCVCLCDCLCVRWAVYCSCCYW